MERRMPHLQGENAWVRAKAVKTGESQQSLLKGKLAKWISGVKQLESLLQEYFNISSRWHNPKSDRIANG